MSPTPPAAKGRKHIKVGALTYAQLVLHMLQGDLTCEELAEVTGLHYVTVLHYTRELHAAGAAHIAGWQQDARGRDNIKLYKIGPGRDAKRRRIPGPQRSRAYREKLRGVEMNNMLAGVAA